MIDKDRADQGECCDASQERREFLKRVGSKAVVIPAAALLIAASQEKASATGAVSGQGCI